jgi:hypothetical protein
MNDLYDDDIVLWAEQQSALLRRLARGDRVNDQVDWRNIIEEIHDVGRSEFNHVRSLLTQAMRHMLKARAWPDARDAANWRADAIDFRQQARNRYSRSMRRTIKLAALYADAVRAMPTINEGVPLPSLPEACPWTLEELLDDSRVPHDAVRDPRRCGIRHWIGADWLADRQSQ